MTDESPLDAAVDALIGEFGGGFDRDYVSVAGPRLAATRERVPQPLETASAATSHRSRP